MERPVSPVLLYSTQCWYFGSNILNFFNWRRHKNVSKSRTITENENHRNKIILLAFKRISIYLQLVLKKSL